MENKRKNVYIVVFIITTIVAATLAVYFGLEYKKLKEDNSKKDVSVKERASLDEKNEDKGEVAVKEVEKIVEKEVEKYGYLGFNVSKENCLNYSDDNIEYGRIGPSSAYSDLYRCSSSGKMIQVRVDLDVFNKYYNSFSRKFDISKYGNQNHASEDYTFNDEIADVFASGIGQGEITENLVLLVVLKDGSLYAMNMYDAIIDNNYHNFVKIDEVSNIIQVESAYKGVTNGGSWGTLIAFNNQGKFYDLENILKNKKLVR